jgi:tetratricopeptide (TPR) repeat protein
MNTTASRMTKKGSLTLILLCTTWIVSLAASGQQQAGEIKGSVRSLRGDLVPGAEITLLRPNGSSTGMKVLSASDGTYLLLGIPYGAYELSAAKAGFRQSITGQFDLSKETAVFDFSLTPLFPLTTANDVKPEEAAAGQKKTPLFSPAGIQGTTAPSGYSTGVSAEEHSHVMDLVVGLPQRDWPLFAASEEELGCEFEDSLLSAVHNDPNSLDANHRLGLFYLQHDDPVRGVQYLKVASQIEPANATNSLDLALADIGAGEYSGAMLLLQQLIAKNNRDPALHTALAEVYAVTGQHAIAIGEYEAAVGLDPGEQNLFVNGLGLLRLGAEGEANAIFTAATGHNPSSARLWFGRGVSESLQHRQGDAVRSLLRAASLDPEYEPTYSFLANLYGVSPDTDLQITRETANFVATHPNNAMAHYDYAEVLSAQRRKAAGGDSTEQIESEFKLAIGIAPGLARAHFGLGLVYYETRRYDEAVIELRRAVQLLPNNAQWHYRLFEAYVRDKEPARADLELKIFKALRAKSMNPEEVMEAPTQELDPQQFLQGVSRGKCHFVNR